MCFVPRAAAGPGMIGLGGMIPLFLGHPNGRSLLGKWLEFQSGERGEGWNRDRETGNSG